MIAATGITLMAVGVLIGVVHHRLGGLGALLVQLGLLAVFTSVTVWAVRLALDNLP